MGEWFAQFTRTIEKAAGSPWAFIGSILVVLIWALCGPLFEYSDTWQLVINTSTTVITFWLVFIIQATQTRDTAALQLKLDELIVATREARNDLVGAENKSKEEIDKARQELRDRTKE